MRGAALEREAHGNERNRIVFHQPGVDTFWRNHFLDLDGARRQGADDQHGEGRSQEASDGTGVMKGAAKGESAFEIRHGQVHHWIAPPAPLALASFAGAFGFLRALSASVSGGRR
ncbi:hypothetical protein C086_03060 [Brucella abortus F6/05-3]|nr:hypothetical protein DK51_2427 [Brucella abortus]ENP33884.1 hypothetical protein C088_02645 [Brucella abortus 65/110]ENP40902.1 hypothetical protein C055_03150 [Brucella abortus 78/36]ENQ02672.1 hypothetical protein C031_02932 [Brucella abortus F6/05-2]ENR83800.1 hypothetical protein B996_02899 [Brucella abortus 78/14]ENR86465.1 hypothetical protein C981_03160 [Brucella abortus 78/32]ENR89655.1 hypothetical protein C043_02362 [Brucella abortus 80/101]ENR93906.1 hypothetical protein B973_0